MIDYIPNKPLYTIINDTKISIDNYVTNNELNIIRLINDYSLGNNYELYIEQSEQITNQFEKINTNGSIINLIHSDKEIIDNIIDILKSNSKITLLINNISYNIKSYLQNVESPTELIIELESEIADEVETVTFYILYSSNTINITFESEEESDLVILSSHRDTNLTNYYNTTTKKDDTYKTYQTEHDLYSALSSSVFANLSFDEFNIDFSDFNNHIFFSSAKAKVLNATNKFNTFYEMNEASSSYYNNTQRQDFITKFSPYEKWLYVNKYANLSFEDFTTYITDLVSDAEVYDDSNQNMIWNSVPMGILEGDTSGYFSNLLLLFAEIFDTFYLYNASLSLLNENPHLGNTINTKSIKDKLEHLGFTDDFFYSTETLLAYYNGSSSEKWADSLKYVSEQIAKRLLHNLPNFYQSKGTLKVLKQLMNVYSIPSNFFEIIEFNKPSELTSSVEMKWSENWWYLKKTQDITCSLNVSSIELSENVTFEFVVNNFNQSTINIATFGGNEFNLISSGSYYAVEYKQSGSVEYTSSYVIPNNNNWTYIGITKDINNSSSIFILQQDEFGDLINRNEFNVDSMSYGTFDTIELLDNSEASITEFKIFNSVLTDEEMLDHAQDFRSIAEIEVTSSLISKFTFLKNTGSLSNNDYTLTITNADNNDYLIDEFYSLSSVSSVNDIYTNKMIFLDSPVETSDIVSLYEDSRIDSNIYSNEPYTPKLGIFISPSEEINRQIVRKIVTDYEIIPDNLLEYNEVFKTELDNKYHLDNLGDKYSNMTYYNFIYSLLDKKIFKIFEKFVPANIQFEYGIMIKNHILKTNKYKVRPAKLSIRANEIRLYEDNDRITSNHKQKLEAILVDNATITNEHKYVQNVMISTVDVINSNRIVVFNKSITLPLKKGNLLYLNEVNTNPDSLLSFQIKNNIAGNKFKTYDSPIETIINGGATFIKR